MPYVKKPDRKRLDEGAEADSPGELNYVITKKIDSYLGRKGLSYANVNEIIGVLECAKLEIYRRVVAKYEDTKIADNGDVYTI
jgi:DNA-directed RNA polymerase specialized sigma54-like protein